MKITERESIIRVLIIIGLIAAIILISVMTAKKDQQVDVLANDTIQLFDGSSLDNWQVYLKDSTANPDSTFFVKDGNLYSSGDPFGYIKTKEAYSDYQLHVEWRWPEEAGNSGVFIHVGEDNIWPVCLECQLKSGFAGDLVCFPGFDFFEHVDKENWVVGKKEETSEKLSGEWNTYDIRVNADSVSIYVNDVLQNIATKTLISSGSIALQSEGAPIEFRNVFLVKKEE